MTEATGEPDLLAPLLPGGERLEKLLRKAQFFSSGKASPDRHEVPPWLVHVWSYPLCFSRRPYIIDRRRVDVPPNEPGTGGRKWRRIGTPN
jgi:hypothetical protein